MPQGIVLPTFLPVYKPSTHSTMLLGFGFLPSMKTFRVCATRPSYTCTCNTNVHIMQAEHPTNLHQQQSLLTYEVCLCSYMGIANPQPIVLLCTPIRFPVAWRAYGARSTSIHSKSQRSDKVAYTWKHADIQRLTSTYGKAILRCLAS